MGEILKATIDHTAADFETTNKQNTISLAKARAQKERPPALKEGESAKEAKGESIVNDSGLKDTGLNIRGLAFDDVKGQEEPPSSRHKRMSSADSGAPSISWGIPRM